MINTLVHKKTDENAALIPLRVPEMKEGHKYTNVLGEEISLDYATVTDNDDNFRVDMSIISENKDVTCVSSSNLEKKKNSRESFNKIHFDNDQGYRDGIGDENCDENSDGSSDESSDESSAGSSV